MPRGISTSLESGCPNPIRPTSWHGRFVRPWMRASPCTERREQTDFIFLRETYDGGEHTLDRRRSAGAIDARGHSEFCRFYGGDGGERGPCREHDEGQHRRS